MDFFAIAKILMPLAPVAATIAGGLVGGPAGAAAAGGLAKIILGKFGLPETAGPAQLSDRIAEAGEETARAKINAAMEEARFQVQGFVDVERAAMDLVAKNIAQTNETIRAEVQARVQLALAGKSEHWFYTAGRPTSLWIFNAVELIFGFILCWATAKEVWASATPLQTLSDAWPLYASYFGPLLLVNGVYIVGRSVEKKAALENGTTVASSRGPILVKPGASEPSKPLVAPPGRPPPAPPAPPRPPLMPARPVRREEVQGGPG